MSNPRDEDSLYYCQAGPPCGAVLRGWAEAGAHEKRHHDGAQTCWTRAQMGAALTLARGMAADRVRADRAGGPWA